VVTPGHVHTDMLDMVTVVGRGAGDLPHQARSGGSAVRGHRGGRAVLLSTAPVTSPGQEFVVDGGLINSIPN